jgi:hypothetical protein
MEWKPAINLTPAATVYGDGLNPKQLEDIIFNADGSFSRKMIGLTGARDKDITRIVFALSMDGSEIQPYHHGWGQFFLKIDRELCDTLVGMKAGFALSTRNAKALEIVDDNGQIILMAGNGKNGTFELWFTGYYEHQAPKNPNGKYPLKKVEVIGPDGKPVKFPADEWIEVWIDGHMNTFTNGKANPDAVCLVSAEAGGIRGFAKLSDFIIADLPGNGWVTAEWTVFSGGQGDIYQKARGLISFRDYKFGGYNENKPDPEPTDTVEYWKGVAEKATADYITQTETLNQLATQVETLETMNAEANEQIQAMRATIEELVDRIKKVKDILQ